MSKAFTKDDDGAQEVLVVPRPPLPEGSPNYVTMRGLAALRAEHAGLERARAAIEADAGDRVAKLQALGQRILDLNARLASAALVDTSAQPRDEVRFGARVRVRSEAGKDHEYQIVGVDEADAESGLVAFSSPLSRALLGKHVGEIAEVRTPRAREELEVLTITYEQHAATPDLAE